MTGLSEPPPRPPLYPLSFAQFVEQYNQPPIGRPHLLEYEHVPKLIDICQRVVDTFEMTYNDPQAETGTPVWTWGGPGTPNYKRVIVCIAPRYFKSEVFSRLLPAYFERRFPTLWTGLASYSSTLATKLSGDARTNFIRSGGAVSRDSDSKSLWRTEQGGGMWSAGILGSITGSGFHLGVMDDPMKPLHARSRAFINGFRTFYSDTWYNRQEPGAAMIVVMQRLGGNDPIDYLYRREVGDKADLAPEHWHLVICDEIRSSEPLGAFDGPLGLPPTCTVEVDHRPLGAVLAPTRFDADEVAKQQRAAGVFKAPQRQQRAMAAEGDFWHRPNFGVFGTLDGDPYEDLARFDHKATGRARAWDTAYTKDEKNSASAHVETFRSFERDEQGRPRRVYVTDAGYRWLETPELVAWMHALPGPHMIEAKASGKSAKQFLHRAGIYAQEVKVQGGDKYARAAAVRPYVDIDPEKEKPRVWIHASAVATLLDSEEQGLLAVAAEDLMSDTGGLDINDAFVQELHRQTAPARRRRGGASVSTRGKH